MNAQPKNAPSRHKQTIYRLIFVAVFIGAVFVLANLLVNSNLIPVNKPVANNAETSPDDPSLERMQKLADELFTIDSIPAVKLYTDQEVKTKDYLPLNRMEIIDDIKEENNFHNLQGKIKARGNSSLTAGLKYGPIPYKVKLSEAVDIFGFGEHKEWNLLNTFIDRSSIRQFLLLNAAQMFMDGYYQPQAKYVEVYLNDDYRGLYLLTETVDAGENRVDIETEVKNDDTEVPFLVELDLSPLYFRQESQNLGVQKYSDTEFLIDDTVDIAPSSDNAHLTHNISVSTPFTLKYPEEFSDVTEGQGEFIINRVNSLFNDAKKEVPLEQLNIDIESFVNYFLFQEVFSNHDPGYTSFFMHQPGVGRQTVMGPLWDFDTYMILKDANNLNLYMINNFYRYLLKQTKFREAVTAKFTEYDRTIMPIIKEKLEYMRDNQVLRSAVLKDQEKNKSWGVSFNDGTMEYAGRDTGNITSYEEHIDFIIDFLWNGFAGEAVWADGSAVSRSVGHLPWLRSYLADWGIGE